MSNENGHLEGDDRWLAAEYALGVLNLSDRRRAESRAKHDPVFEAEVKEWESRFAPMLDVVPPESVPQRVWDTIMTEVGSQAPRPGTQSATPGLWSNAAFWRWLSFGSGALAAASLAALLVLLPGTNVPAPQGGTALVATLNATGDVPAFVAHFDATLGELVVHASTSDQPDNRVAELWVIPSDGTPRSLGVLAQTGTARVRVPTSLLDDMKAGGTLAVSLEPAGGSPTGVPTGPVIASGKMLAL